MGYNFAGSVEKQQTFIFIWMDGLNIATKKQIPNTRSMQ